ncbi:hypothetical protein [Mollivirus kamchatka]|nr:hypothetical protein [Mollivirus kamchatka]
MSQQPIRLAVPEAFGGLAQTLADQAQGNENVAPTVDTVSTGRCYAWAAGPLELNSVHNLAAVLLSDEDAVILIYKPMCSYTRAFVPVFRRLASAAHRNNLGRGRRPVVFVMIDGSTPEARASIAQLLPGLFGGGAAGDRGFPSVVIKRGADRGETVYAWDPSQKRTPQALCCAFAVVFDDREGWAPSKDPLEEHLITCPLDDDEEDEEVEEDDLTGECSILRSIPRYSMEGDPFDCSCPPPLPSSLASRRSPAESAAVRAVLDNL